MAHDHMIRQINPMEVRQKEGWNQKNIIKISMLNCLKWLTKSNQQGDLTITLMQNSAFIRNKNGKVMVKL